MLTMKDPKDFWSGILFVAFGSAGLWFGRDYIVGTAGRIGPGYFPLMISLALIELGGFLLVRSLLIAGEPIERSAFWPQLLILSAIVAFGLLIERLGLAAAVAAVVLISGFAAHDRRWFELAVLAVVLATACVVLFVYFLGQPIPVWGR